MRKEYVKIWPQLIVLGPGKYLIFTVEGGKCNTSSAHWGESACYVLSVHIKGICPKCGVSHGSFREHPQRVMWQAFGEKHNRVGRYLLKRAEDLKSHIWMNLSWFIETLIMSTISWTLSCLSKKLFDALFGQCISTFNCCWTYREQQLKMNK